MAKSSTYKEQRERAFSGTLAEQAAEQTGSQALQLANQFEKMVITDQKSYNKAVEARAVIKDFIDQVDKVFEPMRLKTYEAYKEVLGQRDKVKGRVEDLLKQVNKQITGFTVEQQRIQREKEQEEVRRLEDVARKEREKEAKKLKRQGYDDESIEAVRNAPLDVGVVAIEPDIQVSADLSIREGYECDVLDLWALVKAAAKNKALLGYVQADQKALNAAAKTMKDKMAIPGCRVRKTHGVASKGRRDVG